MNVWCIVIYVMQVFKSRVLKTMCGTKRGEPEDPANLLHHDYVLMGLMTSQMASLTGVYSTVYSDTSKKASKLRVTGLCAGNSLGTVEFPAQMASNAENVSIWWRHQ